MHVLVSRVPFFQVLEDGSRSPAAGTSKKVSTTHFIYTIANVRGDSYKALGEICIAELGKVVVRYFFNLLTSFVTNSAVSMKENR